MGLIISPEVSKGKDPFPISYDEGESPHALQVPVRNEPSSVALANTHLGA